MQSDIKLFQHSLICTSLFLFLIMHGRLIYSIIIIIIIIIIIMII